jgi:hypothetical protein
LMYFKFYAIYVIFAYIYLYVDFSRGSCRFAIDLEVNTLVI